MGKPRRYNLRRKRRERARLKKEAESTKENDSGFDMFCEEHFKEALEHIKNKYPKHTIGWNKTIRDEEFDDEDSMRCGYPECEKESTRVIDWIKFEEGKKK